MEDDPRLYEIFREHLTLLRDGKETVLKNSLPLVYLSAISCLSVLFVDETGEKTQLPAANH
jgi:hypothetical protein